MSEKDGIECPKCGSDNTEYLGPRGLNVGPYEWACYGCMRFFNQEEVDNMTSDKTEKAKSEVSRGE